LHHYPHRRGGRGGVSQHNKKPHYLNYSTDFKAGLLSFYLTYITITPVGAAGGVVSEEVTTTLPLFQVAGMGLHSTPVGSQRALF